MKHIFKQFKKFVEKLYFQIEKTKILFYVQISEAEKEKYEADYAQQVAETAFSDIEKLVAKLQKELRRSINKSK